MAVYLSSLVFGDLAWRPQPMLVAQIVLLTMTQALVMITGAVVVSSQTTSTRAANLLASFIIIPMTLLVQAESVIMFLAPDAESPSGIGALWAIIIGMWVTVVLLLRVGNAIFNREELLGRTIDQLNLKGLFGRIWRYIRAIDLKGTPARNLIEWYRAGVFPAVGRLGWATGVTGWATGVTVVVFIAAVVGGYLIGQQPEWRLPLPSTDLTETATFMSSYSTMAINPLGISWIVSNNARILAAAFILGLFTFGSAALIVTPLVYVVIGYLFSQVVLAGINPTFMAAGILTHGIIEIPVIVLATAAALKMGAIVTRPPQGMTVAPAPRRV